MYIPMWYLCRMTIYTPTIPPGCHCPKEKQNPGSPGAVQRPFSGPSPYCPVRLVVPRIHTPSADPILVGKPHEWLLGVTITILGLTRNMRNTIEISCLILQFCPRWFFSVHLWTWFNHKYQNAFLQLIGQVKRRSPKCCQIWSEVVTPRRQEVSISTTCYHQSCTMRSFPSPPVNASSSASANGLAGS